MYIRAGMNAYLDKTASSLDTLAAEPLRVWRVTGTDEAIEAFRLAVGGVALPDEDIVAVKAAAVVAKEVAVKTEQVAALQASLDTATAELETVTAQLQPVVAVATPLKVASVTPAIKG